MTVMLNMLVVDAKQTPVVKNVKNKSDKSEGDFAQKLTVATDKSISDADAKGKNEDNAQLLAAMAGLMSQVVINPVPTNQVPIAEANGVGEEGTGQITSVVPNSAQLQLSLPIPSGEQGQGQAQGQVVVPSVSAQKQDVPGIVPSKVAQTPLVSVVPSGVVAKPVDDSMIDMVTPKGQVNSEPTKGITLNPLTAVVEGMTVVNPQVADKQIAEAVQLQKQLQNQGQLQNQSLIGQVQAAEVVTQNPDTLLANPILSKLIPTAPATSINNGLVKNSAKQIDGKKLVDTPANVVAPEELVGTVEELTIKPVLASQMSATVLNTAVGENKEKVEGIVPNTSSKDSEVFASLLNQQGMKVQAQTKVEANPISAQPLADPYSITSQIVDQARLVSGAKNTEMIIQLKPEHLGELTFKVSVENGVVSASFHSNNSEVRSILESSLYQLKQEMSNQGLKVDNVGVYAGLGEFFSNGQQSSQGNQQPHAKVKNMKNEDDFFETLEAIDPTNGSSTATGVDYRA